MRRSVLMVAVALVALVSGCGDDGNPTVGATSTPSAAAAKVYTEAQAKAAMLTAAEVGAGFTVDPEPGEDDDSPSGCAALDAADTLDKSLLKADPSADFTKGQAGPFVNEEIDIYASPADSKRSYDAGSGALSQCPKVNTTINGEQVSVTLSVEQFPTLGERTTAYRAVTEIQGTPVTIDSVVVLLDNAQVGVSQTTIAAPEGFSVSEELVRKAVEKLLAAS